MKMFDSHDLRAEFVKLLTIDSETRDARKSSFNQAIFFPAAEGGRTVFTGTDVDMVLDKFDKAARNIEKSL